MDSRLAKKSDKGIGKWKGLVIELEFIIAKEKETINWVDN